VGLVLSCALCASAIPAAAQTVAALSAAAQTAHFKVFLVGDAGEDAETGETLKNLHAQLMNNPNSAVIFLGDNSYKSILGGLVHYGFKGFDGSRLTQKKLGSQLGVLDGYKGHVYFVPGNHDWWNVTDIERGKQKLKLEEDYIERFLKENKSIANPESVFLPANGKPGPESVELADRSVRIIFLDTYRLIIGGLLKNAAKDPGLAGNFYHGLDSVLQDAARAHQQVIIATHHPVYAKGPNTGPLKYPWLFKRIKASNINYYSYRAMADSIRAILVHYPGIYYTSGHVHTLQYAVAADGVHYIVSGAGSKLDLLSEKAIGKISPATGHDFLLWNIKGFFEIEFGGAATKTFVFYENGEKTRELE
jgi:hypothetical protein